MRNIVVLTSQWFRESGTRRKGRLGRNAHRRLHLCTSFRGSSCVKPPKPGDPGGRGYSRIQKERARKAAGIRAHRGKWCAVCHARDGIGLKPCVSICVLPDAALMPPNLFFACGVFGKPLHIEPLMDDVISIGWQDDGIGAPMPYGKFWPRTAMRRGCKHMLTQRA